MPTPTFLQERTLHLLVVPLVCFVATFGLSYSNDHDPVMQPLLKQLSWKGAAHDSYDPNVGGKGTYTISACLNYRDKEPWGEFSARWALWHITILLVTSFKIRVLPREHTARCVKYGLLLWITLLSGFKNWTTAKMAEDAGQTGLCVHLVAAFTLFYMNIVETCQIWWPSPSAKKFLCFGYACVLTRMLCAIFIPEYGMALSYFYGIPFAFVRPQKYFGYSLPSVVICQDAFDTFEYANFLMHLYVVWKRTPIQFPESLGAVDCRVGGEQKRRRA